MEQRKILATALTLLAIILYIVGRIYVREWTILMFFFELLITLAFVMFMHSPYNREKLWFEYLVLPLVSLLIIGGIARSIGFPIAGLANYIVPTWMKIPLMLGLVVVGIYVLGKANNQYLPVQLKLVPILTLAGFLLGLIIQVVLMAIGVIVEKNFFDDPWSIGFFMLYMILLVPSFVLTMTWYYKQRSFNEKQTHLHTKKIINFL